MFGAPVFDYQLSKVKLARMAALIQAGRQFSYDVAGKMAHGEGTLEASMVKAYVCRAAEWVTREAMQLHGGMGYAEEFPVSRFFVDARVLSIFEGADETLCLRVDRPPPRRASAGLVTAGGQVDENGGSVPVPDGPGRVSRPDAALVGRAGECDAIQGALDPARDGVGEFVYLEGEPGIGKTALLTWAAGAATDFLVMHARPSPDIDGLAYSAVAELLAPMRERGVVAARCERRRSESTLRRAARRTGRAARRGPRPAHGRRQSAHVLRGALATRAPPGDNRRRALAGHLVGPGARVRRPSHRRPGRCDVGRGPSGPGNQMARRQHAAPSGCRGSRRWR